MFITAIISTAILLDQSVQTDTSDAETDTKGGARSAPEMWSNYTSRGDYVSALISQTVPDEIPAAATPHYLRYKNTQVYNFTGRYTHAHRLAAPNFFTPPSGLDLGEAGWVTPSELTNYTRTDALDYLRTAIADRNIVIINEAHQMGHHRAFMAELLPVLKEAGFTHFGMEALSPEAEHVWQTTGTPTGGSGYYFSDPMMGHVLSVADQQGFDWFAYEIRAEQRIDCAVQECTPETRIANREQAQAQNIHERVFVDNPNARVALYVGFSHLDEGHDGNTWMAARLAELSGFDPLTIDQVTGSGIAPAETAALVQSIHDGFAITEPSILVSDAGTPLAPPTSRWDADITLFLPAALNSDPEARPEWLAAIPGRQPVDIDVSSLEERPLVVQAFSTPRAERAAPVDQLSILEGEDVSSIQLFLPAGHYEIQVQTPSGIIDLPERDLD
ncbi:hypothetical protein RMQ97_09925 [Maricaulis sp. D1M11]|uniref:hypothetical protein n=1 Tax=Maricaulis sp. D1M11 TaxID=3076117 RepID=UPI0039B5DAFC